MAERDQHPRLVVPIPFVDQQYAPGQQVSVAFERQIDESVEQRVTRCHQGGLRLAGNVLLVEADPPVPGQHRVGTPDQAVSVPQRGRYPRDLEAAPLARPHDAAGLREGDLEERTDVMGLEPPGRGLFHLLPNALDALDGRRVEPFVEG